MLKETGGLTEEGGGVQSTALLTPPHTPPPTHFSGPGEVQASKLGLSICQAGLMKDGDGLQ